MPLGGCVSGGLLAFFFLVLAVMWLVLPFVLFSKLERVITVLTEIRNRPPDQKRQSSKPEPGGAFTTMRG